MRFLDKFSKVDLMTYINGLDVNRGIKNISKHEDKEDIYEIRYECVGAKRV